MELYQPHLTLAGIAWKPSTSLNLIESFFAKMTKSVLRGIRVKSKAELIKRLQKYFDAINEQPVVFKWSYKMETGAVT